MAVPSYAYASDTYTVTAGVASSDPCTMAGLYVWAQGEGGATAATISAPLGEELVLNGDFESSGAGGTAIFTSWNNTLSDVLATETVTTDYYTSTDDSLIVLDPQSPITDPLVISAAESITEQYTFTNHITDSDGDDLENVTVTAKYSHVIEGTDSNDYICIADHTAAAGNHPVTGTWAAYWELYTGDVDAGDWNDGFAYKALATEWTGLTNNDGDLRGAEKIQNGDFAATTGWNVGDGALSVSSNVGTLTASAQAGAQYPLIDQTSKLTVGKTYQITGEVRSDGTESPKIVSPVSWNGTTSTSWQSFNEIFIATSVNSPAMYFSITDPGGTEYVEFQNISVRETSQPIQYRKWLGTSEVQETRVHTIQYAHASYRTWDTSLKVISDTTDWDLKIGDSLTVVHPGMSGGMRG